MYGSDRAVGTVEAILFNHNLQKGLELEFQVAASRELVQLMLMLFNNHGKLNSDTESGGAGIDSL